jgi:predicted ATPase
MTKDGYQFSHDKLRDAFQSMVDNADKQRLHYLIGNQYVLHARTDNDESIFQAAVHLNKSGDYALGKECREKLARINLAAARRCRDKSAFIDAVVFLRHGLKVLDEGRGRICGRNVLTWPLNLRRICAKMELIVGNLDTCKQINEELLVRSKSAEMKIIPLVLDVEVRMAGNEMSETITAAKRALRELGIAVPDRVHIPKFMLKLRKVRRMIRGKDDEYILGLPIIQDLTKTTSMKLLMHLSLYCFLQGKTMSAVYSALLAIELMMQKSGGLSSFSATCVTTYGIVEMGLGNIHLGVWLGELAIEAEQSYSVQ